MESKFVPIQDLRPDDRRSIERNMDSPAARQSFWAPRMGISPRHALASTETWRHGAEVYQEAFRALARNESILITGSVGAGKTHLAVCCCYEYQRTRSLYCNVPGYPMGCSSTERAEVMRESPLFLPAIEAFQRLKDAFPTNADTKLLDAWADRGLLVIDDLGAERVSEWTRNTLYLLIDRRYRMMRPTIITTNLSLEQIGQQIDDRIASRIVEMGIVLTLTVPDQRLVVHHARKHGV